LADDNQADANKRILRVSRRMLRWLSLSAILAGAALAAAGGDARAQGKLDARYTVTLAGVPIGKGAWIIDVADDQYTAAASGMTTGLLRILASGQGSGAARGQINPSGDLMPSSYASTITAGKKTEELRIVLNKGTVKEFAVDPPTPPNPDRIPITEAHRKGVTDPMTAAIVRVPGHGDTLSAEACSRTAAVFDGRMRYDLTMAYKRFEQIKAERGYEGPAVVCAVYFNPIAGHIPDRPAIKYLVAQRDMEIWFAPLAGTRLLVPFRISIPTPLGMGVMEATQFVSTPQAPRATRTSIEIP
jgi:hypothetical protein